MKWTAWFALSVGILAICGGLFDWDWYMELPRARFWVNLFGRGVARLFFIVLGVLLCGGGIWLLSTL